MFDNPLQMILLGMAMLCIGFVLFRGSRRLQKSKNRNLLEETRREFLVTEKTVEARIHQLEVRLLNYQREVEGQVATKMESLRQLMLVAEKQISRLEDLEKGEKQTGEDITVRNLPGRNSTIIEQLYTAGFSAEEITSMVNSTHEEVQNHVNQLNNKSSVKRVG